MSQLQVSGEAKIRDIQGPVVANSGVITALDGAASQYVRGDGTLADFPTSTGGGSSVSYYLNGSVNQGTFAGSTYYEMSKTPIIGAGTDFPVSTNGLVSQFITDANDPDLLEVPGGNFNVEFYFSVSNNTGNPTVYAELYKYDGTTFTLLGSSQAIPESINQGTTIAPYYFAIPVGTAALALTDRIAIRIYANVDSRTVTLHTENSHLCQVVTTFSKGMVSLNNLTDQSQFITTGTSGTNFNIVSSGDTHTFNLPVASATNTGKLSNTDWSTFNNKVPYTGATGNVDLGLFGLTSNAVKAIGDNSTYGGVISIKQNNVIGGLIGTGYTELFGKTNRLGISFGAGSIAYLSNSVLTAERTYTLPDATGTIALTSNLSAYVPYTGATTNVELGIYNIFSSFVYAEGAGGSTNGGILIKQYSGALASNSGYTSLFATPNQLGINFSGVYNTFLQSATLTASRTYTLPDITGTLALLEGTQTFSGSKTFSFAPRNDGGILLKDNVTTGSSGYVSVGSNGSGITIGVHNSGTNYFHELLMPNSTSYNYTFPSSSGTLALTSNLSSYVPYTGATSNVNLGVYDISVSGIKVESNVSGGTAVNIKQNSTTLIAGAGYISIGAKDLDTLLFQYGGATNSDYKAIRLKTTNIPNTTSRAYEFPNADGTIALTSNIPSVSGTSTYIPVFTGTNSLGNSQIWNNGGIIGMGTNYSNPAFYVVASSGDTLTQGKLAINTTSFSGTSVLQVNGAATLTGNLTGTTAAFSSFVNAFSFTAIGGTSNAGQISLKHTGAISVGDGYVTIAADSSNTLGIYFFNSFSAKFSISALTNNRTYTLPDGTGTLALTSNLSAYLPLTGGTLTGALSGTSATFLGKLTIGNSSLAEGEIGIFETGGNYNFTTFKNGLVRTIIGSQSSTSQGFLGTASNHDLLLKTNDTTRLTIASTGAATFSSSVAASTSITVTNSGAQEAILSAVSSFADGYRATLRLNNTHTGGKRWELYSTNNSDGAYGGGKLAFVNATDSTTAMVMTSGGNVGIGTSSPQERFEIAGLNGNIRLYGRSGISDNQLSSNVYYNGSAWVRDNGSFGAVAINLNPSGVITFNTTSATSGFPDERMRITSGGNVEVKSAGELRTYRSDNARYGTFYTDNFAVNIATSVDPLNLSSPERIALNTAGTERLRITSGGFTKSSNDGSYYGSTGTYHEVRSSNNDWTQIMSNTGGSTPQGLFIQYVNASPNSTGSAFLYCRDSGFTLRGEIRSNGGLANYQANNVNLSDERTKKDIIPLESYWDKFKAIEIVKFKYKDQTHEDFNIGVIAQQVESIAPEFIDIDGWGETPEDGVPLKSVYTADLHHATIKVLQEAMAKIEQLEEKVKQLENK